jgi:putative resolvase
MKSKEVLTMLKITRVTLWSYVKSGKIIANKLPNGYYDYDRDSVLKLASGISRVNIIYARVSTNKQKNDLITQVKFISDFCTNNNIIVDKTNIFQEISSGMDLDRHFFSSILDNVLNGKVNNIYISYKDRLTRLSFKTLETIFNKCGTQIIVVSDIVNKVKKDDQQEVYDELIALMHHFSTQIYSKRKTKKNILLDMATSLTTKKA